MVFKNEINKLQTFLCFSYFWLASSLKNYNRNDPWVDYQSGMIHAVLIEFKLAICLSFSILVVKTLDLFYDMIIKGTPFSAFQRRREKTDKAGTRFGNLESVPWMRKAKSMYLHILKKKHEQYLYSTRFHVLNFVTVEQYFKKKMKFNYCRVLTL